MEWSGTITDQALGAETIAGTLLQDICSFGGSIQLCFTAGCNTGTRNAAVDGTGIEGDLSFPPNCRNEIIAPFVSTSPPKIAGTYVGDQCAAVGGSLEMTLIAL